MFVPLPGDAACSCRCQVTLRQIQEGSRSTLQDDLQMEYRIAVRCMHDKDFFEGVRAGTVTSVRAGTDTAAPARTIGTASFIACRLLLHVRVHICDFGGNTVELCMYMYCAASAGSLYSYMYARRVQRTTYMMRFFYVSVLVDKDNTPKWQPEAIEKVTKDKVDWYFSRLPVQQELIL